MEMQIFKRFNSAPAQKTKRCRESKREDDTLQKTVDDSPQTRLEEKLKLLFRNEGKSILSLL